MGVGDEEFGDGKHLTLWEGFDGCPCGDLSDERDLYFLRWRRVSLRVNEREGTATLFFCGEVSLTFEDLDVLVDGTRRLQTKMTHNLPVAGGIVASGDVFFEVF